MYDALRRYVFMTALFTTLGCQTINVEAAKRSLLETLDGQSKAAAERRTEAFSSYFSQVPLHLPPGAATNTSRAAIIEHARKTLGLYLVGGERIIRFSDDGTMAYVFSEYVTKPSEEWGPSIGGRVLTVWRRNSDGRWECVAAIRNATDARFRHL